MKKISIIILFILVVLISCDKKKIPELIIGKWALVGNECSSDGNCKKIFKFMGHDFYKHNYISTVMEFKTGGGLYQPILGESRYKLENDLLKIGINLEGRWVWNDSRFIFLFDDEVLIKVGKIWRKYRRIE